MSLEVAQAGNSGHHEVWRPLGCQTVEGGEKGNNGGVLEVPLTTDPEGRRPPSWMGHSWSDLAGDSGSWLSVDNVVTVLCSSFWFFINVFICSKEWFLVEAATVDKNPSLQRSKIELPDGENIQGGLQFLVQFIGCYWQHLVALLCLFSQSGSLLQGK